MIEMVLDLKTGKLWRLSLCDVTENNMWVTPDGNLGVIPEEVERKRKAAAMHDAFMADNGKK